ncbi:tryptophan--tRNA ligase [Candidatus Saccharibacteria bacterium]|nr:tryptophan--tRNA ligase [Candidatus Saccharibacteria bacterium]
MKKTILTGLRINSELTLGNYLGALLPMVRLANKHSDFYNINIFIPDLHSIISDVEGDIKSNTVRTLKYFLASGLKINENIHFYRQSYVPAHTELAWVLNCIATMGEMGRMTQFKEKSNGKESANVGIFDYPVLMAADILLYGATFVPVGEDQFQHIELTRNLAERFNNRFGETFVVPVSTKEQVEFMGANGGIRVRDLSNPEKKMSKSTAGENSKIMLSDSPEKARKKIMSATTDSFGEVQFDFEQRPGISNLLQIEALVNDVEISDVVEKWRGETRYGELKKTVADSVAKLLSEFQNNFKGISDEEVLSLLPEGEKYANEIANKKLTEVYEKVGLR